MREQVEEDLHAGVGRDVGDFDEDFVGRELVGLRVWAGW